MRKKEKKLNKETPHKSEKEKIENAHQLFTEELQGVINSQEENNSKIKPLLQEIANKNNAVLIAFIASSAPKRVSPSEVRRAIIGQWEELGMEEAVNQIKKLAISNKIELTNLFLLVNSPGGSPSSSYIVASLLRDIFKNIKVFIPNMALSGGTLLTLIGNEIIMSRISKLSPIDTQVFYKGEIVSAQSMGRALKTCDDYFEKKLPSEVPYPRKCMAEKFDPILFEEWDAELNQIYYYARKLLRGAGYDDKIVNRLAFNLIFSSYPHSFVIDRKRAKWLKLNISDSERYGNTWETFRSWYSLYVLQTEDKHIIRYVLPEKTLIKQKNGRPKR